MSLTLTDLTIRAALDGKQDQFDRVLAERTVKEQHWAGRAGLGGDVRPTSRLSLHDVMLDRGGEMCDRLMSEHGWSEADFRHAAGRLEASGDPELRTLAQHLRAMEMYAAEEAGRELSRDMNTMESFLREHGVPMVRPGSAVEDQGRKWPASNAGRVHEPLGLPRTAAPLGYPDQVKPEPIDEDRRIRGATQPAMSERLRGLAMEVRSMARLSASPRTRNRLLQRAAELERMSVRQYEREMENDVATADDPDEAGNALNRIARDTANDSGDGDGEHPEFRSFDDWDNEDRSGSEDRAIDDVDAQKRTAADDMALDEDLPRVPAPGRRFTGEDQLGDPAAGTDEPRGLRRNVHDDSTLIHMGRGGRDTTGGRYGRPGLHRGTQYSGLKRESMRESGDLTATLLEDQRLHWYGSHGSW